MSISYIDLENVGYYYVCKEIMYGYVWVNSLMKRKGELWYVSVYEPRIFNWQENFGKLDLLVSFVTIYGVIYWNDAPYYVKYFM